MKFKDKVVVVTGGASGIGRGMCIRFAGEGASVVVNYSKSKAKAINVVEEINFNGGDAIDIQADVSRDGEARQLIDSAVSHYERLDVLINNAGVGFGGPVEAFSADELLAQLDLNIVGTIRVAKAVLPKS